MSLGGRRLKIRDKRCEPAIFRCHMEEEDQRSKIKRCEPFPDITCVMSRVTRWDMPAKVIRMPGHGSRGGALCVKINDDVHDNLTCPGDDHKRLDAVRISILGLT